MQYVCAARGAPLHDEGKAPRPKSDHLVRLSCCLGGCETTSRALPLRGGPFVTEPSLAVVLSYASQDVQICEALCAARIEVWVEIVSVSALVETQAFDAGVGSVVSPVLTRSGRSSTCYVAGFRRPFPRR
jgi:hypothetical protein